METEHGWKSGDQVWHCDGNSAAFGAKYGGEIHHTGNKPLHPRCWHCHRPLGCIKCSGIRKELLCIEHGRGDPAKYHGGLGPVWATLPALIEHGPLVKFQQRIGNYPDEWRPAYYKSADEVTKYMPFGRVPPDWVDVLREGDVGEMWRKVYVAIKPGPLGDVLKRVVDPDKQ